MAYTEFTDFCHGKPAGWGISFNDIKERLNKFNEINHELIQEEASYIFENQDQEIEYFKMEKPDFQKYGIFYKELYNIELRKRPLEIRYYKQQLRKLDQEFSEIEQYFMYYRSNNVDQDDEYFLKSSNLNHIFALVKANEMLIEYLSHKSKGKTADEIIASYPKVKFKIKQNEILEFSKAMIGVGAVEGTLKDVSEYLGKCFGVEMKNVYNKSNYIKNRMNPVRFLEKLINWLKRNG